MRNAGGYSVIYDPAHSQPIEQDTFTCGHCQRVVFVQPMMDAASMGGRCTVCDTLICQGCLGKGCEPMEEKLLRMEGKRNTWRR